MLHVTFFLNQRGDRTGGWTFSLWNTRSDDSNARAAINDMAAAIQLMTGNGCNVQKARISEAGSFRVADEIKYTYDTGLSTDEEANADYQTTAIGIQFRNPDKTKVTQSIRGIADKYVWRAGRVNQAFATSQGFISFTGLLKATANGWVMRTLVKSRPKKVIKAISDTGVVTCTAHGFDGSVQVRVERVKKNKYPNQIWDVESIDANTFQLIGFDDADPGGYGLKGAKARPQTYGPVAIATIQVVRATSHRTGRPTDLLTGKSKIRA